MEVILEIPFEVQIDWSAIFKSDVPLRIMLARLLIQEWILGY
jgi:hypothetical protein